MSEQRRRAEGDDTPHALAAANRELRQRLDRLERFISGRLGDVPSRSHRHDARYVEVAGDTMTGPLTVDGSSGRRRATFTTADGEGYVEASDDTDGGRNWLQIRVDNADGSRGGEIVVYGDDDDNNPGETVFRGTDVDIDQDLNVDGITTMGNHLLFTGPDGGHLEVFRDSTRDRWIFRPFDSAGDEQARIDLNAALGRFDVRHMQAADLLRYRIEAGSTERHRFHGLGRFDDDLVVVGDFDVGGAKNAKIPHPDDPTRAFKFAAVEADEPGLLCHRWLNVHVDREATLPIPDHWGRIARDPMVMVSHADEPDDSSPRAPFGWADLGESTVTVRAPTGSYHVLLVACRADLDGRWSHEVAVDPEPDEPDDEGV